MLPKPANESRLLMTPHTLASYSKVNITAHRRHDSGNSQHLFKGY